MIKQKVSEVNKTWFGTNTPVTIYRKANNNSYLRSSNTCIHFLTITFETVIQFAVKHTWGKYLCTYSFHYLT